MKRILLITLALALSCMGAADTEISAPNGGWTPRNGDDSLALARKSVYWLSEMAGAGQVTGSSLKRHAEVLSLSGTSATNGGKKARRINLYNAGYVNVKVELGSGGAASAAEGIQIIPPGQSLEISSTTQVQPICTPLTSATLTVVVNYLDAAAP